MLSECAKSDGQTECQGMSLHCIWRVEQDLSYQVDPQREAESDLVAVRTLSGEGVVDAADYGHFLLPANSLLICEMSRLRHYGTAQDHWGFIWFEFARESGVPFPWYEILAVMPNAWETQMIEQLFARLARPDAGARAAASARFNAVLYDWATRWQRPHEHPSPHREMVYHAIQRMQRHFAPPLNVEGLAEEYGVSARWFRQVFSSVMGLPPKQYYADLRLQQAAHALRMGLGTISQVAEQFGYSSPFHFSRAFKSKFGCSPSQYLAR